MLYTVALVSKATHRNTKRPSSSSQRSARSSQLKRAANAQCQDLRPALALGALAGFEFGVGFGHGEHGSSAWRIARARPAG